MEIVRVLERPFLDLLLDSLVFAERAEKVGRDQFHECSRYSRAAILAATCSLESAANCCLESLGNGAKFRDDVDRLPVLSKFELFLGVTVRGRILDRGSREVQAVQELKGVRDSLVHPKTKSAPVARLNTTVLENQFERTPILGISRSSKEWTDADAVTVLSSVTAFLSMFLVDLCGFDHNYVCSLLLGEFETDPAVHKEPAGSPFATQYSFGDTQFRHALDKWHLNLRFLGLGPT